MPTGTEQIAAFIVAGELRPSDWEVREFRAFVDTVLASAESLQAIADAAWAKHADALQTLARVQEIWGRDPRYIQHGGPPTTRPPGALFVGPPEPLTGGS